MRKKVRTRTLVEAVHAHGAECRIEHRGGQTMNGEARAAVWQWLARLFAQVAIGVALWVLDRALPYIVGGHPSDEAAIVLIAA